MRSRVLLLLVACALLSCGDRGADSAIFKHWQVEFKSLSDSSTFEVDTLYANEILPAEVAGRERLYHVDSALTSMTDSLATSDHIELLGEAYQIILHELEASDLQDRLYHVTLQLIPNSSLTAEYVFSTTHGVLEEIFPHARWETPVRYRLLRSETKGSRAFVPEWEEIDRQLERIDLPLRPEVDLFEQAESSP